MIKISRKSIQTALWSLGVAGLIISLGFSNQKQEMQQCKGLRIKIADQTGHYFIEPGDVLDVLNSKVGKVKGSHMKDINMTLLEKIVYSNPFIGKAEVYSTIDGYVNIDVWQRNPVLRIVNHENEHFYVDDQGDFMPVSDKYSSPVIVASGAIYDDYAERSLAYAVPFVRDTTVKPVLVQLNEIAMLLRGNEFWDAQIEQIFVNPGGEIELIPRIGDHIILIGTSDGLAEKLERLFVFYNQGINKAGWDRYTDINLKFANQVICTRNPNAKDLKH